MPSVAKFLSDQPTACGEDPVFKYRIASLNTLCISTVKLFLDLTDQVDIEALGIIVQISQVI